MPGSSWGAGAARGVPTWYRVPAKTQRERCGGHQRGGGHPGPPAATRWHPPVYCPRNVTAPGGLPGLFHGEWVARGAAGEGSESEAAAEERGAGWEPAASAGSGPTAAGSRGVTRSCLVPTVPQPHSQPLAPFRIREAASGEEHVPAVPSVPTLVGSHLLRSRSGLSRGSDADLPLLVGVTLGATLPRTGGLGSLWRGQSCCHHPDPGVPSGIPLTHHTGWAAHIPTPMGDRPSPSQGWVLPLASPGPSCHLPRGCCVLGGRWSAAHLVTSGTRDGFSSGVAAGPPQGLLQPPPQPPHLVAQRPDGLAAAGQSHGEGHLQPPPTPPQCPGWWGRSPRPCTPPPIPIPLGSIALPKTKRGACLGGGSSLSQPTRVTSLADSAPASSPLSEKGKPAAAQRKMLVPLGTLLWWDPVSPGGAGGAQPGLGRYRDTHSRSRREPSRSQ